MIYFLISLLNSIFTAVPWPHDMPIIPQQFFFMNLTNIRREKWHVFFSKQHSYFCNSKSENSKNRKVQYIHQSLGCEMDEGIV
jgi:hypothetical protein